MALRRVLPGTSSNQTPAGGIVQGISKTFIEKKYPGFIVQYHHPHIIPIPSTFKSQDREIHPLKAKVQRRYQNIDSGLLWAAFTASTKHFESGIVGSKSRKRLRHAFKAAMTAHNLDWNGRKLDLSGQVLLNTQSPIKGTLIFTARPEILKVSMDELKQACLDHISTLLSRSKYHK